MTRQYSDEELLQLERDELDDLSEEQVERYNELKEKELKGELDEYQKEQSLADSEGMEMLVEGVTEEFSDTIEIGGHDIRVMIDPDKQDFSEVRKIRDIEDKQVDELDEESYEQLEDLVFTMLGRVSVDYDKSDWEHFAEVGDFNLMTMSRILDKIFAESDVDFEQKKMR